MFSPSTTHKTLTGIRSHKKSTRYLASARWMLLRRTWPMRSLNKQSKSQRYIQSMMDTIKINPQCCGITRPLKLLLRILSTHLALTRHLLIWRLYAAWSRLQRWHQPTRRYKQKGSQLKLVTFYGSFSSATWLQTLWTLCHASLDQRNALAINITCWKIMLQAVWNWILKWHGVGHHHRLSRHTSEKSQKTRSVNFIAYHGFTIMLNDAYDIGYWDGITSSTQKSQGIFGQRLWQFVDEEKFETDQRVVSSLHRPGSRKCIPNCYFYSIKHGQNGLQRDQTEYNYIMSFWFPVFRRLLGDKCMFDMMW